MVKLRPRQQLAVCLAAVLLSAGACEGGDEPEEPAPVTDKVTYLTGFGAFGREGFAWVAKEKEGRAQFALIDYAGAVVRAHLEPPTSNRAACPSTRN